MIQNILLCTDGSVYSMVTTEYALWLAKRLGAQVRAVHVSDIRQLEWPFLADISGSIGAQPYQAMIPQVQQYHKDKARVILDGVKQSAKKRGVGCLTFHKTGRLTESVLEEEQQADLVVLGQRGEHAEQTGDMMGSSVERIVRRSIKPCMVTPGKFQEISHVLLAFDGSHGASRSLQQGIDLASALGLPMTIVSVTGDDTMGAEVHLHEALELAKGRGLAPRGQLLKGNAEDEILKYAEQNKMDLIVMGAYGHTRIREFILGSTTSHVIRKSRVPVMLTR
jgi:nucleotide-binding universal stress UspA family protein